MSSREKALEMLKSGVPWEEVSIKFGKSTLYSALAAYFPLASARVKELREEIFHLEVSVTACRKREADLSARADVLHCQVDELESHQTSYADEVEALSAEVESKRQQLRNLEDKVEELRKRGVTEETVSRIDRIEFGDGGELLGRIDTFQAHQELVGEVSALREELKGIEVAVEREKKTLDEAHQDVAAECNLLDEWRRKAWMWKDAQNMMLSFFKDGYDTATLIGLKRAVNILAVKGKPKVTVKRLLDALWELQELTEIEATLRQKKTELTRTQKELDKAKGSLKAVKENILDEIESALKVSSRHLRTLNDVAVKEIREQGVQSEERFKRLSEDLNAQVEALRENAETSIRMTGNVCRREIQGLNEATQQCLKDCWEEVQKWGEIKEEMGAYTDLIEYGYVLMGVLKNPEAITKIPPEVMVQIVERLHLYVLHKFPDVYSTPSPNAADKEYSLNQYMRCRLSSLVEWLKDDLNTRLLSGGGLN